ncbi:NAD(P)-dependent oxidoreductase [Chitinophaga lutea]|uniref:NAD(P)-dependent oxidoreductase n=1 Tax=Chitinophaga lutea TaxID=2488634 RepID=A0A3N4PLX6_9BACT|nr:NAD(P)-binding domain-containing protein [Chitinophaga lutea]RPE09206.1 NAD(P)-dependent oxidoreductase [Chitinophaga lutea]
MTGTNNKVSVIGLGVMGSAIARAFIAKGFEVTIWNRDHTKAAPLIAKGATLAANVSEAVEASPVLVICVADYKVTRKIFEAAGATAALNGRTIVQLSTGTPKEARELEVWAKQHGAHALNGDILAWPRQIGTDEATITVSGNENKFKLHETVLKALGGSVSYLGEEAGASAVQFSAVMAYLAGSWIGFTHGALIMENEGMRTDEFGALIEHISPILAVESRHMGTVIQHSQFTDPESTIQTTGNDLHLLVQQAAEAGISSELPKFAADIFQRAIDAGYGAEEHAAIIKVLRKPV